MKPTTYAFVAAVVFGLASFSAYNVGENHVALVLMFIAFCGAGFLILKVLSAISDWFNK